MRTVPRLLPLTIRLKECARLAAATNAFTLIVSRRLEVAPSFAVYTAAVPDVQLRAAPKGREMETIDVFVMAEVPDVQLRDAVMEP